MRAAEAEKRNAKRENAKRHRKLCDGIGNCAIEYSGRGVAFVKLLFEIANCTPDPKTVFLMYLCPG